MVGRFGTVSRWLTVCAIALSSASAASAQEFKGRIDINVEDASGAPQPGATVDLEGQYPDTQTSDAGGRAHFLNLPPGTYTVKVTLAGMSAYTNDEVEVSAGSSTRVAVKLAKAADAADKVKGAPAGPTADERRTATRTVVDEEELQNIPSARDPWSILPTVPTVYVDTVDVGGIDSATQPTFSAKGADVRDNTWTLDGVPVTDMSAAGGSLLQSNVDILKELSVTTGGADVQNPTGGVGVNMVLKSGMNKPAVNARYLYSNDWLQWVNTNAALATALGDTNGKGDRVTKLSDVGFDIGGPLIQDRVWLWGTMAWTDVNLLPISTYENDTGLKTYTIKADGVWKPGVRGNFIFYENNVNRPSIGASALRPAATTWSEDDPTHYWKGEGNFVVKDRFFATARGAYINGGTNLLPAGGLSTDYYFDANLVAHNTFYQTDVSQPQYYGAGNGSYFTGPNELSFGGSWRATTVNQDVIWPASHIVASWTTYPAMSARIARDYSDITNGKYVSAFASDTLSLGRLTIVGGVRFDQQTSSLGATSVPGVTGVAVLPALSAPQENNVYRWNNLTPRVGITAALDESRKTIVRASYAMYASQLSTTAASFVSPIHYSYAYYNAVDRNGDGVAQLSEVLFGQGLLSSTGFNPANPSQLYTVNTVDPKVKAPTTQEMLAGIDRELSPTFGVTATFTYRRMDNLLWDALTGVTSASYTQTGTLTGTAAEVGAYSVPLYALKASAVPPGGGQTSTNRPGYHQQYTGLEVGATKRMSKRWMARIGVSTNNWREYFDNPALSILDPTKAPAPDMTPAQSFVGPQNNGGMVVRQTDGSGQSSIYMLAPTYQFVGSGLWQGPWAINVAVSAVIRQGYAEPFYASGVATGDPLGPKNVLVAPSVDSFRLPTVTSLDGRLEKTFRFGPAFVAIDLDVFNLLNADTTLGKEYDVRATNFDQTLQIMNPRMTRLGVRFRF
jgi:hypothetical protein